MKQILFALLSLLNVINCTAQFWEKLDANIIGENYDMDAILTSAYWPPLLINDEGLMVINHFISSDAGNNWQHYFDEITHNGNTFNLSTTRSLYDNYFIASPNDPDLDFLMRSENGRDWEYYMSTEELKDLDAMYMHGTLQPTTNFSFQELFTKSRNKTFVFHGDGKISLSDPVETYYYHTEKKVFERLNEADLAFYVSGDRYSVTIGERDNPIFINSNGVILCSNPSYGSLISFDDGDTFVPILTGLMKAETTKGFGLNEQYPITYERVGGPKVICDYIFIGGMNDAYEHTILFSVDGKNWIDTQLENPRETERIRYNPSNKRFYAYGNDGLYVSRDTFNLNCSGSGQSTTAKEYGTTIITHGYQLGGTAPIQTGDWAYNMGKTILQEIENKGCIRRYNKSTGHFDIVRGSCEEGETILLFDWAEESDDQAHGYTEAAGDALFSALLLGQQMGDFDLANLHFIGHSRGTVVNSECVLRLLTIGIPIDHVTNLDPHDWGVNLGISRIVDDFDVHPEFPAIPGIPNSHQAVVSWEGVNFTDTYFQDAGLEYANCGSCAINGGLEGRAVAGSFNELWNYYGNNKLCHSNIHSCGYQGSIPSSHAVGDRSGGYKFSRISGGIRPTIEDTGRVVPNFDFFNPLIYTEDGLQNERIRGVMNGGFDRIGSRLSAPGWIEHGGAQSNYPSNNVTFENGFATLSYSPNAEAPAFLRHNRCYVPNTATGMIFSASPHNLRAGELEVVVVDMVTQKITDSSSFILNGSTTDAPKFWASLASSAGKVVTFEFRFRGVPINVDLNPILQIREVAFHAERNYLDSLMVGGNSGIEDLGESHDLEAAVTDPDLEEIQLVSNGLTLAANTWETVSGGASFSDGLISLDAITRKGECKVVSHPFKVAEGNNTISLSITPIGTITSKFNVYIQTANDLILVESIDIKSYLMDDFENTLEQLGGGERREREAELITINLSSQINNEVQVVLELVHQYGRSKVVKVGIE